MVAVAYRSLSRRVERLPMNVAHRRPATAPRTRRHTAGPHPGRVSRLASSQRRGLVGIAGVTRQTPNAGPRSSGTSGTSALLPWISELIQRGP
jgi:hypothetical protein